MKNIAYYCQTFAELNVSNSRKRGNAKYKPILLLSVIDLIARGVITINEIPVSDELIQIFERYWNVIGSSSYKGGLHYPFFHLQNEGFWYLKFKPEFNGLQPKTINKLKEAVEYAYLDSELFNFLQDEFSRKELIDALVAAFFSDNKNNIETFLQINQTFQDDLVEIEKLIETGNLDINPRLRWKRAVIRNAFFRTAIIHIYDYRCAFCGLKVTKKANQNIVDGAHIKPFSQFYNSKINNGIALCKNHHWAFDRGWFAVDEQYKIIVSNDLEEVSPHAKPMKYFHGETILLPNTEQHFPELEALQWHRQNIFQA
ncbi:HNH endonuclease [Nostoc sp. 'Lobaria pulmonaria (5183) cyanobiont']|uniref:HNH endonuclease n=1 Tax=Nostoc sp. 'Lobaria pulmonaria (5183) cyanobiont' TaxID=1618022 RepID=UPI000CF30AB4|nr:HNH endonuclease [Nostoc sp. 'Lobaria pulmonaria (5183) cyanobiont']AVH70542.1 HNH endonuclease [Nostoc sp. 'Lobaria pulmonaria (5183) cyanobiont']